MNFLKRHALFLSMSMSLFLLTACGDKVLQESTEPLVLTHSAVSAQTELAIEDYQSERSDVGDLAVGSDDAEYRGFNNESTKAAEPLPFAAGADAIAMSDSGSTPSTLITGDNRIDDTNVDPRWPEVVAVSATGGSCSGTLISPVHVLTAGHCGTGVRVRLDTPAGGGSGPLDKRRYDVVDTEILSATLFSGQDLAVMLLDRAVPSYGTPGEPGYAVDPAFAFADINTGYINWTVGFGTDCGGTAYGTRRGLMYNGGFSTYDSFPGVITRRNLGCGNPSYEGPNQGDSGGPLLDVIGRVVGVFSGWSCRSDGGVIGGPGCTGTIEWTGISPVNAGWLDSVTSQDFDGDGIPDAEDPRPALDCTGASPAPECDELLPDFEILDISAAGCTGSGGDPVISTTIRNNGPVAESTWVDVFTDLPAAPSVGDLSPNYRMSDELSMGQTQTLYFTVEPAGSWGWIDVIVDTTQSHDELDESNNVRSAYLSFPDCSFN